MSFTVKALADLMFAYIDQSGTTGPSGDVTNASAAEKGFIALAMTQALKEARKLNPGLFVQRPGIVLRAPRAGTLDVTQYSTAVTLGTLTVPNDGCTVRIGPDGLDNELNETATPGTYELRREHESGGGSVQAQLWHDCWVAAEGTLYESVLGDVRANGRPLAIATSTEELDRYRLRHDFGQPTLTRVRPAGQVQAVLCEPWASPFATKIQTRLRFAPMPSAATVVDATLVAAAPVITSANLTSTAITFQIPQQLDETVLFPLAMKRFSAMPIFRAPSDIRRELTEQYLQAVNELKLLRGHYAAEARIVTE